MEEDAITYDLSILDQSLKKWHSSSGLRYLYGDLYRDIIKNSIEGSTLEIGSGIGKSKEFINDITTSDIIKTPFVDRAVSAYALPLKEEGMPWANIVMVDVLHHLLYPLEFFESASKALISGGRIIMVEPAATCFGRMFYKLFHHEPMVLKKINPPFRFEADPRSGEFANMAMGVGMFVRNESQITECIQSVGLKVVSVQYRDFIGYPATGGYSKHQLLPTALIRGLIKIERLIPQKLLRHLSLRMVITLEKVMDSSIPSIE